VGFVVTNEPLIFFTREAGERAGFICGEGFWKWNLHDAVLSGQRVAPALITRMVQYLAVKSDTRLLRISSHKRYDENEPVTFEAELYNQSFELVNTPDVQMKIRNKAGKSYDFTFSRNGKGYTLDAGVLLPGSYTYNAEATVRTKKETANGSFTIVPLQIEFLQTVADHQLLNELSRTTGGKMFYPSQTDQLIETIKASDTIKPVIYEQEEVQSWINLKWIALALILLLSIEWFVRKWNGAL
jgi:hypothetical protein